MLAVLVGVLAARGKALRWWRAGGARPRRIANSAVLLSSPLVRRRVRQRRFLHAALGVLVVVGLVCSSVIAGRPVDRSVRSNALASRDIVLCLDVSTSMLDTDVEILDTFTKMLDTFEGERVALVVWNTTAQTMVPLTDDYDLLRSQFEEAASALDFNPTYANPMSSKYITTFGGTLLNEVRASSLIGDGLASCSLAFDTNKVEDRSRSIVLASDNQAVDPEHQQVYSPGRGPPIWPPRRTSACSRCSAPIPPPWTEAVGDDPGPGSPGSQDRDRGSWRLLLRGR